ncbi:MAG: D-alanyl-D-alanine carboxypeptidase/D-alanyl-D-alanine endopeptidase [Gammaproteobacteria bacterium]
MIKKCILFSPLLLALTAAAHANSPLAPLAALQHKGARVSALVVNLDNGKVLASLDPDTALTPASTSKLFVTAAVLAHWGPDYRFRTRLLATGPVTGGTLHGNLVFAGAGDPAVSNEMLAKLVRRLKSHGIKRIAGDLIVNAGYFGKVECITSDRCAARKASGHSYDSNLSSAAANFSNAAVAVTPASKAGSTATVRQTPYALPMFQLHDQVRTRDGGRPVIALWRTTHNGDDVLTVQGHIPVGSATDRYYVSVGDPDRYSGELLAAFLAAAGIRVEGKVRVSWQRSEAGREIVAVQGQPIWILLRRMLIWSNNFMADTFALDFLRAQTVPPLSLTAAGAAITHFARGMEKQSHLMHERKPKVFLASGSGLTASSRVSARDLASLLDAMYRHTGLFPSFLGALTVPAHTPVHMLKRPGDRAWMQRIAAKTGSFPNSFKVFALAGYIRLPGGGWGAFAVLVNGTKKYEPSVHTDINATRAAITPFLRPKLSR